MNTTNIRIIRSIILHHPLSVLFKSNQIIFITSLYILNFISSSYHYLPIIISLRYDWQNGLGGWTQMKNDTFDFSTYSGSTPSVFTGPKTDHTYQEESGRSFLAYYLRELALLILSNVVFNLSL